MSYGVSVVLRCYAWQRPGRDVPLCANFYSLYSLILHPGQAAFQINRFATEIRLRRWSGIPKCSVCNPNNQLFCVSLFLTSTIWYTLQKLLWNVPFPLPAFLFLLVPVLLPYKGVGSATSFCSSGIRGIKKKRVFFNNKFYWEMLWGWRSETL